MLCGEEKSNMKGIRTILLFSSAFLCNLVIFGCNIPILKDLSFLSYLLLMTCLTVSIITSWLSRKITIREIAFSLLLITVAILGVLKANESRFMIITLFSLATIRFSFRDLIRYDYCSKVIIMIVILSLMIAGLISDDLSIRDGVVRHAMGFPHPNSVGFFAMTLMAEKLYLYKTDKTGARMRLFAIAGLIVVLLLMSDSRTAQVAVVLCVIAFLLIKMPEINKRIKKSARDDGKRASYIMPIVLFACIAISIMSTVLFLNGDKTMVALNEILSNRIYISSHYFKKYGISLLGQLVQRSDNSNYSLDNAYMRTLINYGVLSMTYLVFVFCSSSKKALEKEQYFLYAMFAIYAIYGLMEAEIISLAYNPFLLATFSEVEGRIKR